MRVDDDRLNARPLPASRCENDSQLSAEDVSNGDRRGFTLVAALLVLVLMGIVVTALFNGGFASYQTTTSDYQRTRVFYAAEGGAEAAMSQLSDFIQDGFLSDQEIASIQPSNFEGFQPDSFSVRKIGAAQVLPVTQGPFAGLNSLAQDVQILSEFRDDSGNSAAVLLSARAQAIPIFQFGIFFEKDLEIVNGAPMDFEGRVHSNGNIYIASPVYTEFHDIITTPNKLFRDRKNRHEYNAGSHIDNAAGTPIFLNFDSRTHPTDASFKAQSEAKFDGRVMTDAFGVDSLRVPLPSGMDPVELMRPREVSDTDLEKSAKFAWKADWVITVDMQDIRNGNTACGAMSVVRGAGLAEPIGGFCNSIFEFHWNQFWDGREDTFVDELEIDVQELFNWTGGAAGRRTEIMYISFINVAPGDYPIIRMVNGDWLGNPFTFSSERPVYIDGDYNIVGWQPAAIVGDAIVLLSNRWDDARHQNPWDVKPSAWDTEYNMAVLGGHGPTSCDHEAPGCFGSVYGGGVHNFLRFLESWNSDEAKYRGSLVSLHFSTFANGNWSRSYYDPPDRNWSFDTRFRDPSQLPPGTPVVGNVIQTAFRPVF